MNTSVTDPTTAHFSLHGLTFLWLEVTAKCNLECIHCYADSGPQKNLLGKMNIEDWVTILRDSAELGCRQVQFIGGEPTLHPELPRMISFASAYTERPVLGCFLFSQSLDLPCVVLLT